MRNIFLPLLFCASLFACKGKQDYETVLQRSELYSKVTNDLTEVITYDIFNPPVASRIYAYSHLAAYEVMAHSGGQYLSLAGQLKDLKSVPSPAAGQQINFPYAALTAFMEVGRTLTFSKEKTDAIVDSINFLAKEHGMPEEMQKASVEYGTEVAKAILAWSKTDNYAESRSAAKYTVNNDDGKWIPTPPAYFQAVEPKWMTIRSIVLDSSSMFLPAAPTNFSKEKGSDFYKMATEIYEMGNAADKEQVAIADFWDCNGFKMNVVGHAMYATKAMTPGGHWMGITGIVCKDNKADFATTVYTYMAVSFGVMDGFIACWDAKYHWSLIRPETYINLYIDNAWKPHLQTPPFPEHTSGHSVISSAAATVLSTIFNGKTAFTDSTERSWGWPDRKYKSVHDAANEASLSRMYGGIHFRPAIEEGVKQGEKIGNYIFAKLKMKTEQTASK